MAFNAQEIVASLSKSGIARSSHFEVQISGYGDASLERDMMVRAETVDLPGRTLATTEYRVYGPIQRIPYNSIYNDATVTFILSEDLREKEYFDIWQDKIANTGTFNQTRGTYSMQYYDFIKGIVTIRQYGETGSLNSVHTLNEAYPISIGPVSMNWQEENPARMTITFAYKDYKVVYNRKGQPGLGLPSTSKLPFDIPNINNLTDRIPNIPESGAVFKRIRNNIL